MYISNYDKEPVIKVDSKKDEAFSGYGDIINEIKKSINGKDKCIVTVECYPGVRQDEILTAFANGLSPRMVVSADDYSFSGDRITKMIERELTDDRVFGVLTCRDIEEFFDNDLIEKAQKNIEKVDSGIVLIYGVGASLINKGDILIYADMARWEIQQRFRRKELGNWKMENFDEDILKKYKRGFFVEWRIADRLKKRIFDNIDYILDTNKYDAPVMATKSAIETAFDKAVSGPFRVVPYFDSGVWGGQWMKKVCGLDDSVENYAWCFDGVPEENSLYLQFGEIRMEIPSIDLVFFRPHELLGEKVHARFGTEFPIRFDFLDTMGGQNLSLQVHPLTEYIQQTFGMHYTQDESYYILDVDGDTDVYLGLKEGIDRDAFINDLEVAQKGKIPFPADKYVNRFPAKKHDHFLIPAGTVHCSTTNSMVLEISATPYIFTFKLWDWDRLGLDGLPRPVHIEHGKKVIQWDRTTKWVKNNLVGQVKTVDEGDGWKEESTGLHEREFIETRRHWFSKATVHNTNGGVNVLNLVEGREALVSSPSGMFEAFTVHYAETFIVPAMVGEYVIEPCGESEGKEIATIKAYVRN